MKTEILVSLMVIGLVAVAIGMGTYAYFSDTETSTGNTFTAGTLDLWLDVTRGNEIDIYNGRNMVIFNLDDIKPGDSGEKTISMHVDNDAWMCIYLNKVEEENGCNEPEREAEPNCETSDLGELGKWLYVTIWFDEGSKKGWDCKETPACSADQKEGNNQLDTGQGYGGEWIIWEGYAKDLPSQLKPPAGYPHNEFLQKASDVVYIGIKWEFKPQAGNEAQSDKLTVDATFYAVQYRNNPSFECPSTFQPS